MPKQKSKSPKKQSKQYDSTFLFKLVIYLFLGSVWLKFSTNNKLVFALPLGLIVGLIITTNEHFRVDRKIEYALLLIAALVGFWAQFGIYLKF
jgi:ABC-type dipeptide/oligopeptide/nickel transport system permease component